jgi:ubiquinone/menaquinone biosynthesis C-methylase UbiE
MQKLAQVGSGLCFAGLGPEEKCEVFAGLGCVAVKHKKRQQRSHAVGVDRCDQMLSESKSQLTQQLNTDRRHISILQKN